MVRAVEEQVIVGEPPNPPYNPLGEFVSFDEESNALILEICSTRLGPHKPKR